MNVTAIVYMSDGRISGEVKTTRDALSDFWQRNEERISAAVVDINMTRWFWSTDTGWQRATKFRYVPNRPDLWSRDPQASDLTPTTARPF